MCVGRAYKSHRCKSEWLPIRLQQVVKIVTKAGKARSRNVRCMSMLSAKCLNIMVKWNCFKKEGTRDQTRVINIDNRMVVAAIPQIELFLHGQRKTTEGKHIGLYRNKACYNRLTQNFQIYIGTS